MNLMDLNLFRAAATEVGQLPNHLVDLLWGRPAALLQDAAEMIRRLGVGEAVVPAASSVDDIFKSLRVELEQGGLVAGSPLRPWHFTSPHLWTLGVSTESKGLGNLYVQGIPPDAMRAKWATGRDQFRGVPHASFEGRWIYEVHHKGSLHDSVKALLAVRRQAHLRSVELCVVNFVEHRAEQKRPFLTLEKAQTSLSALMRTAGLTLIGGPAQSEISHEGTALGRLYLDGRISRESTSLWTTGPKRSWGAEAKFDKRWIYERFSTSNAVSKKAEVTLRKLAAEHGVTLELASRAEISDVWETVRRALREKGFVVEGADSRSIQVTAGNKTLGLLNLGGETSRFNLDWAYQSYSRTDGPVTGILTELAAKHGASLSVATHEEVRAPTAAAKYRPASVSVWKTNRHAQVPQILKSPRA